LSEIEVTTRQFDVDKRESTDALDVKELAPTTVAPAAHWISEILNDDAVEKPDALK
jgi:hypothetical protein